METVLIYIGKMILCSAVLFGYYHLALKDRTFHHYNRFYLLAAVLVSLLLPLLKMSYFTVEVNSNIYLLLRSLHYSESSFSKGNDPIYFSISLLSAGAVGVFLLSKLAVGIFKIRSFRRRFPKEELRGISFYYTDLEDAPFSFFKSLFWKNSIMLNSDLGKQILKHEMVHIEQKHSSDKLFMELLCSVLWFNPVFWLIKKELYLIHEYLADNKAVINLDTKAFVKMLLASHFSGYAIPATNPFLNSNLKKRLKMLQKPKTKFGYLHRILALPLVFTMAFAYAVNTKNIEISELNADIQKIINERETTIKIETSDESEENSSAQFVTSVPGIKTDTVKKNEKHSDAVTSYDPMALNLFRATDENLFIVNGKEVLREDFINFYLANRNDKKYSFGSTNQTFSKIFESGKTAAFSVFKEGADEETKKTLAIIGRYLNMPKEDIKLNAVPKSTPSGIKRNNGELKNFFEKAEKERNQQAQNTARKKAEMDARIMEIVQNSKYKDNYFPGRNYNLQPLTAEETADLKEQASKIEKIVSESAANSSIFMNFFRTNALSNYTFNLNGELLNEDKINRRDIVLPLNSDHTTFYMNGKKVPRDKVMRRTDSAADAETFLNDTNIKEIKQEYVTDGIRKYLYRFELITK